MFLKTNSLASLGLMAAFSLILMYLGNIIEMNTIFFMAAAAFLVGAAVVDCGLRWGIAFFLCCDVLAFLLLPNKLYCITYSAFSIYILGSEAVYYLTAKMKRSPRKTVITWGAKYLIFNAVYIPIVVFFPKLLIERDMPSMWVWIAILCGQAGVWIFDMVYVWFQKRVWNRVRNRKQQN